jgi:hypothetical protein
MSCLGADEVIFVRSTQVAGVRIEVAPASSFLVSGNRHCGGSNHLYWETAMILQELVIEMKLIERRLTLYEEKYGILSEDFYSALMAGKLTRYDEYDETRSDFSRWKGIYETWVRRKQAYTEQLQQRELTEAMRIQPAY